MDFILKYNKEVSDLVLYQLKSHWSDINENIIKESCPVALKEIEESFTELKKKCCYNHEKKEIKFSPYFSVHWMLFLYKLSRVIYKKFGGGGKRSRYGVLFK